MPPFALCLSLKITARHPKAIHTFLAKHVSLSHNEMYIRKSLSVGSTLVAGGLAGMLCWLSVLPFDVVKSRMQADCPDRRQYRNMTDCFRQSYKADGLPVFFRGAVAMSARAFPVNGVTFVVYETLLEYCNKRNR